MCESIFKEIMNLDKKKVSQNIDIPTRIAKENVNVMASFLCLSYNDAVINCSFPNILKNANVTPI